MTQLPEKIIETVVHSKELPTLPVIASKLLTLTAQEETTLTDIADLISQDIALSTKILRVANSSFYSFPQQVSSINQAVSILGMNAVRSLVLSFSFFSLGNKQKKTLFDFEQFWERSVIEASATKLILEQVPNANSEEAFTCGLLQNVGQLIFAITLPNEYDLVQQKLADHSSGTASKEFELESEIIGVSHDILGYEVARVWGLPESLRLPIKFHHNPTAYKENNRRNFLNIRAVYLASLITQIFFSDTPEVYHDKFRSEAKHLLGLKIQNINTILRNIDKVIEQSAQYFNITIKSIKSVGEILQEANLRLSLINLSYEEMNRELIKSKMALEKLTEELAQKNRLLENLANIDGLTEISNHRYFQNYLDSEINRSTRNGRTISLLLADIDHFKKFNDTYGHQTGDFILREFSALAKSVLREYDLIARYGGEEFAIVLPETESEEAMVVAEKVRQTVADHAFDNGVNTFTITISIGVASAHSESGFNKDELISNADEALYDSKKAGRNKVTIYNSRKNKKWFSF